MLFRQQMPLQPLSAVPDLYSKVNEGRRVAVRSALRSADRVSFLHGLSHK